MTWLMLDPATLGQVMVDSTSLGPVLLEDLRVVLMPLNRDACVPPASAGSSERAVMEIRSLECSSGAWGLLLHCSKTLTAFEQRFLECNESHLRSWPGPDRVPGVGCADSAGLKRSCWWQIPLALVTFMELL